MTTISLSELRDLAALLTRTANAPMDAAAVALHNARNLVNALIIDAVKKSYQK